MAIRSAREVLDDHLALRCDGSVEADVIRNYSEGVRLLTHDGVLSGHDGVRECARRLRARVPEARFSYVTRLVEGETAFIEWKAEGRGVRVEDGADSFVIRDGLIVVQTIHYTVQPAASAQAQDGTGDVLPKAGGAPPRRIYERGGSPTNSR